MSLIDRFQASMAQLGYRPSEGVLLAVSGGLDSLVLLQLCLEAKLQLEVAHVNYGLRGAESDADEALVREVCRAHQLQVHVKNLKGRAELGTGNLQAQAREMRYVWMDDLLMERGLQYLLTAHHADDTLETFFLQLGRGAGPAGLSGLPPRSGRLLRPLLGEHRKALVAYAQQVGISWREDQSNASLSYKRNAVRHRLLPVFRALGPGAEQGALRSMNILSQTHELLQRMSMDYIALHGLHAGGEVSLEEWHWLFANKPVHHYVLDALGFSAAQLPALERLTELQAGRRFTGKRFAAYAMGAGVVLQPLSATQPPSHAVLEWPQGSITAPLPLHWHLTAIPVKLHTTPHHAYLDADLLEWPLTLRPWQAGDKFKPLGMPHFKKVSDFLTDIKCPQPFKNQCMVLCSGEEICWVAGHRIDDRFKLDSHSSSCLHLHISQL